jgi:hypothetical protein
MIKSKRTLKKGERWIKDLFKEQVKRIGRRVKRGGI